ncbi:MAG: hypothetical protein ACKOSR_02290, partial [Flavobacteriales bacterium]
MMRILGMLLICGMLFMSGSITAQATAPATSFWFGFMSNGSVAPEDVLTVTISSSLATSGVIEIPGQEW